MYAMQAAEKAYIQKEADSVSILVMNPSNGEVMAMVDYPEFDLNDPFTLIEEYAEYEGTDEEQEYCNQMWRNHCINDTYEPGSTFKIITATAALEEQVVSLTDNFYCPGYVVVEDRKIRCHKTAGHGAETFVEGIENSCNPVFVNVGLRIGAERFYDYFEQFRLLNKTGIDLPGEAATIMHKRENIGLVELATISFGQSFQITPIQLATTVSSIINGGTRVTPHLGVQVEDDEGNVVEKFSYETEEGICSEETSEKMRYLLQQVVAEGGGNKAYIEGYEIGGKTATSQTLPRSSNRYIASFLGFSPVDDPKVLVLVIIRNPSGVYYGGTIAAPVAKEIFENILPYLELE
jgi:stage V sporulation protein D (sporulation-specific penicillin-binding protein)